MNDIRLVQINNRLDELIRAEVEQGRRMGGVFLNRNDGWKRDYSMPKDTEAKVNPPATLVGGKRA